MQAAVEAGVVGLVLSLSDAREAAKACRSGGERPKRGRRSDRVGEHERLIFIVVAKIMLQHRRGGTVDARVCGDVFRVRLSGDERGPIWIGRRLRIAVPAQSDRGDRPPRDGRGVCSIGPLASPGRDDGIGSRDGQLCKYPRDLRTGRTIVDREPMRGLTPVGPADAGVEPGDGRLVGGTGRAGLGGDQLHLVVIGDPLGSVDAARFSARRIAGRLQPRRSS